MSALTWATLFTVNPRNHPISVAFNCAHGDTEDVFQLGPWSPRGLKGLRGKPKKKIENKTVSRAFPGFYSNKNQGVFEKHYATPVASNQKSYFKLQGQSQGHNVIDLVAI